MQTVNSLGAFRAHLRETSAKREQLRDVGIQYVVATEEQNFVDEVLKITNGREQMSFSRLQRPSHRGQAKRWRRG
jgi:NADPH:quinone reductase-like Zn-dependent oxidoreductase